MGDYKEVNLYGTHPLKADTDSDGLDDPVELFTPRGDDNDDRTNPVISDTDHDGILDGSEVDGIPFGFFTNPLKADTDDDGLFDGLEVGLAVPQARIDGSPSDTDLAVF